MGELEGKERGRKEKEMRKERREGKEICEKREI